MIEEPYVAAKNKTRCANQEHDNLHWRGTPALSGVDRAKRFMYSALARDAN